MAQGGQITPSALTSLKGLTGSGCPDPPDVRPGCLESCIVKDPEIWGRASGPQEDSGLWVTSPASLEINCILSRPDKKMYHVKWLLKMEASHARIPGNEKI